MTDWHYYKPGAAPLWSDRRNDWRHFRVRPGAAHLWALTPGGVWRTHCARLCVLDLDETTVPLTVDNLKIRKCRVCLPQEPRRKETAV